MNTTGLHADGNGCFRVTGPMVLATAADLLEASHALFTDTGTLRVDLSGVTQVDSAALALVIEWLRQAQRQEYSLRIEGSPEKLLAIARLSGIEDIIKL